LVAITASKSSGFMRSMSWSRVMPALLTTTSSRPKRSTTSRTAPSTASKLETSQTRG
jgi:hypothetical protein